MRIGRWRGVGESFAQECYNINQQKKEQTEREFRQLPIWCSGVHNSTIFSAEGAFEKVEARGETGFRQMDKANQVSIKKRVIEL